MSVLDEILKENETRRARHREQTETAADAAFRVYDPEAADKADLEQQSEVEKLKKLGVRFTDSDDE